MTAAVLAECGIFLRNNEPGEHRAPCPKCDKSPRDDALAVRVGQDGGATWFCHRCHWKGGGEPEQSEQRDRRPIGRPQPYLTRKPQPETFAEPEHERRKTLAPWGHRIWNSCRPIEPGTVAATYLARRGCALPPWPDETRLRWHPNLVDRKTGYHGPALVALVTDIDTVDPINLHRTWLAPDGSGKAPIDKPRRLLKAHRSRGVVRLWPDEEITLGTCIAEGIETALAAARGFGLAWSTISASNLATFPVLPGVDALTIVADHDRPNRKTGKRPGLEAAEMCAAAWLEAGREVRIWRSPTEGEDLADWALAS